MDACTHYLQYLRRLRLQARAGVPALVIACKHGRPRPLFTILAASALVIACRRGCLHPLFAILAATTIAGAGACAHYLQHPRRLRWGDAPALIIYSICSACAFHCLQAWAPAPTDYSTGGACDCRRGHLRLLFTISSAPALVIACRRGRLLPLFTALATPAIAGMGARTIIYNIRGACVCHRSQARVPARAHAGDTAQNPKERSWFVEMMLGIPANYYSWGK
jgi:hypothetical protein